jgi:hypothetical protein
MYEFGVLTEVGAGGMNFLNIGRKICGDMVSSHRK